MTKQKLTKTQRNKLRNEVSTKTLEASLNMLKEFGKCMVIRPTGFGKSFMLARISNKYKSSLYVYPTTVIKNSVIKSYSPGKNKDAELNNVTFISYSELNNRYKDGTILNILDKYEIIMLDEVHMAGATGFMLIWDVIKNQFHTKGKHIIGVTATPNRQSKTKFSDGTEIMVDVLHTIFDGHKVFDYTLRDCINSGLMLPLIYAQIMYDTEDLKGSIRKRIDKAKKKVENNPLAKDDMNQIIKQLFSSLNNIENAPTQIKKIITNTRGKSINYLKFITFCRNKQDIDDKRKLVSKWFEEAFTDMNINEHIIVSKSTNSDFDYEDEIKTVDILEKIKEENNTIDIIYCVDMLNMGYHINDIDGIIMLRGTESEIVYFQQVGRCMSITSEKQPIVLDFVRNADVHSLFEDNKKNKENTSIKENTDDEFNKIYKDDIYISDIEDGTGSFLYKIDEAMNYIENQDERETDLICWWYTEMSAPIYTILQLLGKPITTKQIGYVINKLKSRGITIESEKKSIMNMGPQYRAALPKVYLDTFNKD